MKVERNQGDSSDSSDTSGSSSGSSSNFHRAVQTGKDSGVPKQGAAESDRPDDCSGSSSDVDGAAEVGDGSEAMEEEASESEVSDSPAGSSSTSKITESAPESVRDAEEKRQQRSTGSYPVQANAKAVLEGTIRDAAQAHSETVSAKSPPSKIREAALESGKDVEEKLQQKTSDACPVQTDAKEVLEGASRASAQAHPETVATKMREVAPESGKADEEKQQQESSDPCPVQTDAKEVLEGASRASAQAPSETVVSRSPTAKIREGATESGKAEEEKLQQELSDPRPVSRSPTSKIREAAPASGKDDEEKLQQESSEPRSVQTDARAVLDGTSRASAQEAESTVRSTPAAVPQATEVPKEVFDTTEEPQAAEAPEEETRGAHAGACVDPKPCTEPEAAEASKEEAKPNKKSNVAVAPQEDAPSTEAHPKVEEEEFFSEFSKLYLFDGKAWQEKGFGEAKLLKNAKLGKVRFIMRQEKTMKVLCNHLMVSAPPYCELFPSANGDPCWVWTAQDFADDDMKVERLALKLNTAENAKAFKDKFEQAKQARVTTEREEFGDARNVEQITQPPAKPMAFWEEFRTSLAEHLGCHTDMDPQQMLAEVAALAKERSDAVARESVTREREKIATERMAVFDDLKTGLADMLGYQADIEPQKFLSGVAALSKERSDAATRADRAEKQIIELESKLAEQIAKADRAEKQIIELESKVAEQIAEETRQRVVAEDKNKELQAKLQGCMILNDQHVAAETKSKDLQAKLQATEQEVGNMRAEIGVLSQVLEKHPGSQRTPTKIGDLEHWCSELQLITQCASERRSRDSALAASVKEKVDKGEDSDRWNIQDFRDVLRQREDRLAFGMMQMGRGLEADIASLEDEIVQVSRKRIMERSRCDGTSKRCQAFRRHSRGFCLRRPFPASRQRHQFLALVWLSWLHSSTEARVRVAFLVGATGMIDLGDRFLHRSAFYAWVAAVCRARAEHSVEVEPATDVDRSPSPARTSREADGSFTGPYDIGARGAALAVKLQQVADALSARDPVLAMLVSRLGGIVLTELRAASTSLSAAYDAIGKQQ